jgi:hypothetical protein
MHLGNEPAMCIETLASVILKDPLGIRPLASFKS